jgi:hypothetical protein
VPEFRIEFSKRESSVFTFLQYTILYVGENAHLCMLMESGGKRPHREDDEESGTFGQANEVSRTRMLVNYKFCTRFVASSSSSYSCLDFVVAGKILPVVKNQHLLLCTLLIGNALAMEVWSSFVHISS